MMGGLMVEIFGLLNFVHRKDFSLHTWILAHQRQVLVSLVSMKKRKQKHNAKMKTT